ncbi:hypothetical protein HaLaN_15682, partial [Haematococcus lacustris]
MHSCLTCQETGDDDQLLYQADSDNVVGAHSEAFHLVCVVVWANLGRPSDPNALGSSGLGAAIAGRRWKRKQGSRTYKTYKSSQ